MDKQEATRIASESMRASILRIIARHSGVQTIEVVKRFVASEGYKQKIAPLIEQLEATIIGEWSEFHEAMVSGKTMAAQALACKAQEAPPLTDAGKGLDPGSQSALPSPSPSRSPQTTEARFRGANDAGDSAGAKLKQNEAHLALTYGSAGPQGAAPSSKDKTTLQPLDGRVVGRDGMPAPKDAVQARPPAAAPATLEKKHMVNFAFPNASMGQPYLFVVVPDRPLTGVVVKAVVLSGTGLNYVAERNSVEGLPSQPGEFAVEVLYSVDGGTTQSSQAKLVVNADPKSLWKNIPSDKADPYWKPDEDWKFVRTENGSWCLVAGSKRGRSHAQKGTFRDDDFFLSSLAADGWQIAIVSDGAGGSKYSRRGSALICSQAGQFLERALESESGEKLNAAVEAWGAAGCPRGEDSKPYLILRNELYTCLGYAAHHALKSISDECERRKDLGGAMRDYSSTVLMSIVRQIKGGVFCATFSVGDGAIAVLKKDGSPEIVCAMDSGEFSGQTRFLSKETVTQDELIKRLRFVIEADFDRLFLMTDGISDPYFQTDVGMQMQDRWRQLVHDIESAGALDRNDAGSAEKLVAWLDFWSKGEHDDRTLAVIF